MHRLSERLLDPAVPGDLQALQELHGSVPDFYQTTYGRPPAGQEAEATFLDLPPGKGPEDKVVLGFFEAGALVGCAELLRSYPDPSTAYLGLLLVSQAHQGRGLGRRILERVYDLAAGWGCEGLRLAVIATNGKARRFWLRQGFLEVARKPYPGATGPALVLQRPNPRYRPARPAASMAPAEAGAPLENR